MKRPSEEEQARWLVTIREGGAGRRAALLALYNAYRPLLLRRFRSKGFAMSEAEDMLHELILKVVDHAGQFKAEDGGSVSAWVHVIGRNLMMDRWRAQSRLVLEADGDVHPDDDAVKDRLEVASASFPHTHAAGEDAAAREAAIRRCVRAALQRFAQRHPADADAINLSALEGWSMKALAEFIGRNPGATREFVAQGRKKLRPYIKPCLTLLDD